MGSVLYIFISENKKESGALNYVMSLFLLFQETEAWKPHYIPQR